MNSARKASKKKGGVTPREKNGTSKDLKVGKDSGRVKVFVRVRPFSKEEKSRKDAYPYELSEKEGQFKVLSDEKGHAEKTYAFDHVFPPNKTNAEVCKTLTRPLVQSALNGFNGTLMAYGQTGAGKTYTLMSDTGITKSMIDSCFNHIQDDLKHNYKVAVSYLQIYQEKIYDLLDNNNHKMELTIRENPRTGVYVENLSDYVVRTPTEVLQFLSAGKKRLVFAETKMNRTSSRSHAVLQMLIERTLKEEYEGITEEEKKTTNPDSSMDEEFSLDLNSFGKDVIIRGKLYICDLAGSERIKRTGASGDRLSEAQHINSSLLELGNVIQALADKKTKHVPFRNSVLTRLLQESLGGNCKTSLIVCVSPSIRDSQETKCTLNFGSRAMKVTNTAYVNMEVDYKSLSDQLLKQLEAKESEIHKMKQTCDETVQRECADLVKKLEHAQNEAESLQSMLNQTHADELQALQDQIYLLNNEVTIKSEQLKRMEESLCVIDDDIKRDKKVAKLFIQTQEELAKKLENETDISILSNTLNTYVDDLQNKVTLTEHGVVEYLFKLQEDISKLSHSSNNIKNMDQILAELEARLDTMAQQIGLDSLDGLTDNDFQMMRYKHFLKNILQQLHMTAQNCLLKQEMRKITNENHDLITQIQNNEKMEKEKKLIVQDLDVVDSVKLTASIAVQTESENVVSKPGGRKLVGTTVEDEEKVVTEIQTENVVENPDIMKARDVFSGFSHTLDRIETLVKNDRKSKNFDSIASRFGLTSYLRDDDPVMKRSVSTYEYKSDDSFSPLKFGASSYKPFSGSSNKLNTIDSFESKYSSTARAVSPLYRSSKYDFNRSYGGSSFEYNSPIKSATSFDNIATDTHFSSSLAVMGDRPCLSCGTRSSQHNGEKLKTIESDKKNLEKKCLTLESTIDKLKQENEEYTLLIEQLTRVYPNDNKVHEIKRKLRTKPVRIDGATQTFDHESNGKKAKDYNGVKVAHIKPLPSDTSRPYSSMLSERSHTYSPTNINVTYDMNENSVVHQIDSTQGSYSSHNPYKSPSTTGYRSNSNPSSPYNRRRYEIPTSPLSYRKNDSVTSRGSNLIEFSPVEDKSADKTYAQRNVGSPTNYSSSVFDRLRKSDKYSEQTTNRSRPQTWYGFSPDTKEASYTSQYSGDGSSSGKQNEKGLNLPSRDHNTAGDVIFSSNTRRSSWSIPDWMKTKKKQQEHVRQFIQ